MQSDQDNKPAVIKDERDAATPGYVGLPAGDCGSAPGAPVSSQIIHDGLPAPDKWAEQVFASAPRENKRSSENDHYGSQAESPPPMSAAAATSDHNATNQNEVSHPLPRGVISSAQLQEIKDRVLSPDDKDAQIEGLCMMVKRAQQVATRFAEMLRQEEQEAVATINEQGRLLLDRRLFEDAHQRLQADLLQKTLENRRLQQIATDYKVQFKDCRRELRAVHQLHEASSDRYDKLLLEHEQRMVDSLQVDTDIMQLREVTEAGLTTMMNRQEERQASNRGLVVQLRTKIDREVRASNEKDEVISALQARVQETEDAWKKEHQKLKLKRSQNKILQMKCKVRGQQVKAYRQGVQQELEKQKEQDETRELRRGAKRRCLARLTKYVEDELEDELACGL